MVPVLSIGKMAQGQEGYYLDAVAQAREDYYLGKGEAPGRWVGGGAALLGVQGEVASDAFRAVFAGKDPSDPAKVLGQTGAKVPGFDVTLSAPKSVSVLWAIGGKDLQDQLRAAHDDAVDTAVTYAERTAAYGRRGKGGHQRIATTGFVAGIFRHRTSRAGDPNLHSHVVIANQVLGADGKWSALDGSLLYRQGMATAAIYRAQLRENLRELGLQWEMREDGLAEIAGVPKPVLRAFSKRRREIEARMAERGLAGPSGAQTAALDTRRAKEYGVEPAWLEARWISEALDLGYGREQIDALLEHGRERAAAGARPADQQAAAMEAVVAPTGLTQHASSFDERDVIRALARRMPDGASLPDLMLMTRQVLDDHPEVVRLPEGQGSLRRNDGLRTGKGWVLPTGMAEARYTTRDMLRVEHELVASAEARKNSGIAVVRPETAGLAIGSARDGQGLSGEQAHMVRALVLDGDGVAVVNAIAGAGKTTSLGAAVKAWQAEGVHVVGTTLSAKAAGLLRDETGMPTFTCHQMLMWMDRPEWTGFAPGAVVIVDEAGQVGSRTLHRLETELAAVNGKLVAVGDDRQMPEIDAGGGFRGLAERLGPIRLTTNYRQVDPVVADRLLELRAGQDPAEALAEYDRDGMVTRAKDAHDLANQMAADWSRPFLDAAASRGRTVEQAQAGVVMLALTNADVHELNERARAILAEVGVLTGDELKTERSGFRTGDHVITRLNDQRIGVVNGERWIVEAVDVESGVMAVRHVAGKGADDRRVVIPADYVQEHVVHGYALTVSIAQGQTVKLAYVRGSEATYREALYVAASRSTHETRFYVVASAGEELGCDHAHGTAHIDDGHSDPFELLQQAAGRSRAKYLAMDTVSPAEAAWAFDGRPSDLGIAD